MPRVMKNLYRQWRDRVQLAQNVVTRRLSESGHLFHVALPEMIVFSERLPGAACVIRV